MEEHGVNWNGVPTKFKRGTCCIKIDTTLENGTTRKKWCVDFDIPIFTQDRDYIEKLINF